MSNDRDYLWAEVTDIGQLLHELDEPEFDTRSLCDGWAVRDVVGHMALGHTSSWPTAIRTLSKYRFNLHEASAVESKAFFAEASPAEIRAFWDTVMVGEHPRKGIASVTRARSGFLDHLIHNQDIRRPTARSRSIPEERLIRALEISRVDVTPLFSPKKNLAGLTMRCTDLDWTGGSGPVVEGPAETLLLAAGGRRVAIDELSGDGVTTLRSRTGA